MAAQVIRTGALDVQVCVPADWTNEQVKEFADRANPCGTTHGWAITREGVVMEDGEASGEGVVEHGKA